MSFLVALVASALAGSVTRIELESDKGAWEARDRTDEAWVERGGQRVPLAVGADVADDERVHTDNARVTVKLSPTNTITIYPGSTIRPEEFGVLQELGNVLYDVRGNFRVQYGHTEAAVEGTRFVVSGNGADGERVKVERGHVRVKGPGGEVHVLAGQLAVVGATGLPAVSSFWSLAPLVGHGWQAGLQLGGGGSAQGSQVAFGPNLRADVVLRRQLVGPLRASLDIGIVNGKATSNAPALLGVEGAWGPVSVGAGGGVHVGQFCDCATGEKTVVVKGGGWASVGVQVGFGHSFSLEGRVLGGYGAGPYVDTTVGFLVGF